MRLEKPLRPLTPNPRLYVSYLWLLFIYYWIKVEMKLRLIEDIPMPTLTFEKQRLGTWIRDDGEAKVTVNEENMYREIQKLILDGWDLTSDGMVHGNTYHARKYELTRAY
jgi:hypothetical protein